LKTGFADVLRGFLLEENTKIPIDSLRSKLEFIFSILANLPRRFAKAIVCTTWDIGYLRVHL